MNENLNHVMISIIMSVYNVEKYIDHCVRSILEQDFHYYEIIMIDDGSTDASGRICDLYAEKYNFIRVLHKSNEGLYQTRIDGARMANGEYLWFVDSDDWIMPKALDLLYTEISKKNHPDLLIFKYLLNGKDKCENEIIFQQFEYRKSNKYILYKVLCNGTSMNAIWRKCIKRELIINNTSLQNLLNFSYGEDIYISSCVIDHAEYICMFSEYLYAYRVNDSSMTRNYNFRRIRDEEICLKKQYELAMKWETECAILIDDLEKKIQMEMLYNIKSIFESCTIWKEKWKKIDEIIENDFWSRFFNNLDIGKLNLTDRYIIKNIQKQRRNKIAIYIYYGAFKIYQIMKRFYINLGKAYQ